MGALEERHPEQVQIVPLDVGSDASAAAAVLAATCTDRFDLPIGNVGVGLPTSNRAIREPQDYAEMHRRYAVNALGGLRIVGALLPLLDAGTMKRPCVVSSEAGSVARATRTAMYGYCLSKAALNMATRILFNDLPPQGYTPSGSTIPAGSAPTCAARRARATSRSRKKPPCPHWPIS